jgi:RNA polymerase sigma-70 factor (ECF subfamily)
MDLLEAARHGNQSAFSQLFDDHHLPLFRFAYRMTGSVADAEDVVQECFVQLLRPNCRYDPERTGIRIYLFGIVRNLVLQNRRKGRVRTWLAPQSPLAGSPEGQVIQSERARLVANAVLNLPDTQREVLILSHYEQMPLAEIARLLSLELGAVKSRLQRGRAQLKDALAAYDPGMGGNHERHRTR